MPAQVAEKKRGEVHRHVAENLDELLDALTPEAEERCSRVQARAAGLAEAAADYLGFAKRIEGLLASVAEIRAAA